MPLLHSCASSASCRIQRPGYSCLSRLVDPTRASSGSLLPPEETLDTVATTPHSDSSSLVFLPMPNHQSRCVCSCLQPAHQRPQSFLTPICSLQSRQSTSDGSPPAPYASSSTSVADISTAQYRPHVVIEEPSICSSYALRRAPPRRRLVKFIDRPPPPNRTIRSFCHASFTPPSPLHFCTKAIVGVWIVNRVCGNILSNTHH